MTKAICKFISSKIGISTRWIIDWVNFYWEVSVKIYVQENITIGDSGDNDKDIWECLGKGSITKIKEWKEPRCLETLKVV